MAILTPTDVTVRVTWLGVVRDRAVTLESAPRDSLSLGWDGPEGECHGGLTRPSCSRVKLQYPRGTEIRNARQLSILSAEELAAIAADLGLETLPPAWTGANMVVEGAPDFTQAPPASRLIFETEGGGPGASLAIDMENGPCRFVGETIEKHRPGHGSAFPRVAAGRRGVTAWVEKTGVVALGDVARLHVPPQRVWPHARPARSPREAAAG
ncbi:MOSC domain-containing protein [Rubrimonas cliftonensis]|uniref:MOSC domain-containing protein n=1 Tax=Rubrimonas cliftonensis TaxID=89524 RepID=A0A1H3VN52_9RHOB|nr:MOSC domain-containing protein [Rubrimonas cliftonensis]SDZ76216.1 MOSC domain-containing protein [Rubrimonas cliftonensis]